MSPSQIPGILHCTKFPHCPLHAPHSVCLSSCYLHLPSLSHLIPPAPISPDTQSTKNSILFLLPREIHVSSREHSLLLRLSWSVASSITVF